MERLYNAGGTMNHHADLAADCILDQDIEAMSEADLDACIAAWLSPTAQQHYDDEQRTALARLALEGPAALDASED